MYPGTLKLTYPLKMDGWKTFERFLLGYPGFFSGANWLLVSGRASFSIGHLSAPFLSAGFLILKLFCCSRQDAISPTMGVVLCKAALTNHKGFGSLVLLMVWVGWNLYKDLLHQGGALRFQTKHQDIGEKCPKICCLIPRNKEATQIKYKLILLMVQKSSEIQLNHHWKDV